jgi:hypothetical protein
MQILQRRSNPVRRFDSVRDVSAHVVYVVHIMHVGFFRGCRYGCELEAMIAQGKTRAEVAEDAEIFLEKLGGQTCQLVILEHLRSNGST